MSEFYLENYPNMKVPQFGWPRNRVSGVIGVHTTESGVVPTGADPGAENTAGYLTRRDNHGSYHALADWDTRIKLVRPRYAAWADVTNNRHAMSVSGAMNAARWRDLTPERAAGIVRNMAIAAAELVWDAIADGLLDSPPPARRITAQQAIDGTAAGFYGHGETNPGTRYDPGQNFDWNLFLATYAAAIGGTISPQGNTNTSEEDDMFSPRNNEQLAAAHDDANRVRAILTNIEEPLHAKLLRVNRWVKGDKSATVYEIDGGKLRAISALEWKMLGRPAPAVFPQTDIDTMPKAG